MSWQSDDTQEQPIPVLVTSTPERLSDRRLFVLVMLVTFVVGSIIVFVGTYSMATAFDRVSVTPNCREVK